MNRHMRAWLVTAVLVTVGVIAHRPGSHVEAEESATIGALDLAAQKESLAELNSLIGGWRGTGQPRRGSNTGAWREDATWSWEFSETEAALIATVSKGKLASTFRVTAPTEKRFHVRWTTPEGDIRELDGAIENEKLTVLSEPDDMGEVYRLTMTRLNEKRTLILFEKQKADQQTFTRMAEVGYTREGTRLAGSGGGQPECVVTGGLGTIKVEYQGKTYYVCCSGCQQAFNDDPKGILADYDARREKEKNSGK